MLYTFDKKNKKGETLEIIIHEIYPDNTKRYSLPNLWFKSGATKKLLPNFILIKTNVTDKDGVVHCGKYNPQEVKSPFTAFKHVRALTDFDWILECTEENRKKLIAECVRRFMEA